MTARKVVDLHPPEEPKPDRPTGYAGRIWDAERMHTTGRWAVVGRLPGRPGSFTDVLEVRFASSDSRGPDLAREIAKRLMEPDPFPHETQEESA